MRETIKEIMTEKSPSLGKIIDLQFQREPKSESLKRKFTQVYCNQSTEIKRK